MAENNIQNPRVAENITVSVDLSSACREFYQSRRKAAENVKEKLATSGRQQKVKTTSMDIAVSKLRTEMVCISYIYSKFKKL